MHYIIVFFLSLSVMNIKISMFHVRAKTFVLFLGVNFRTTSTIFDTKREVSERTQTWSYGWTYSLTVELYSKSWNIHGYLFPGWCKIACYNIWSFIVIILKWFNMLLHIVIIFKSNSIIKLRCAGTKSQKWNAWGWLQKWWIALSDGLWFVSNAAERH